MDTHELPRDIGSTEKPGVTEPLDYATVAREAELYRVRMMITAIQTKVIPRRVTPLEDQNLRDVIEGRPFLRRMAHGPAPTAEEAIAELRNQEKSLMTRLGIDSNVAPVDSI